MAKISLDNSNLYLVGKGKDINGNSVVKISFANGRAFSIQTNQTGLFETKKILQSESKLSKISKKDLKIIDKQVVKYIKSYGSEAQKKRLKTY